MEPVAASRRGVHVRNLRAAFLFAPLPQVIRFGPDDPHCRTMYGLVK
jgi:hypothetical protein